MKNLRLKMQNYTSLISREASGEFRNTNQFAEKKAAEHNAKVGEMAEKIYQAYLPKGEEVAKERRALYIEANSLTYTSFI